MPPIVKQSSATSHREELASIRGQQAKAELRPQGGASRVRELAAEAIRAVSGNARAAAIDLRIHEGHLSRQLKDGSLRLEQIETLGAQVAAEFGRQLVNAYGPMAASPAQRLRHLVRQRQAIDDELLQLADFLEEVA